MNEVRRNLSRPLLR